MTLTGVSRHVSATTKRLGSLSSSSLSRNGVDELNNFQMIENPLHSEQGLVEITLLLARGQLEIIRGIPIMKDSVPTVPNGDPSLV